MVLLASVGTESVRGDSHDTPRNLVSNTGQSLATGGSGLNFAQQFTTGSNESGYVVTEVRIRLEGVRSNTTRTYVTIKDDDGGNPGSLLANLSNPSSFTASAINTFTVPTTLTLDKDTSYWVVINEDLANPRLRPSL